MFPYYLEKRLENPSEEVDDDEMIIITITIIIILNKSQEMTFFPRAPEIDFRHETKDRKVMVDFKFYALYRKVFIKSLLKLG